VTEEKNICFLDLNQGQLAYNDLYYLVKGYYSRL